MTDMPETPEKIDVKPPRIAMGERMLGEWTANDGTSGKTPYVREDIHKALSDRVAELEAQQTWNDVRLGQVPSEGDFPVLVAAIDYHPTFIGTRLFVGEVGEEPNWELSTSDDDEFFTNTYPYWRSINKGEV